MLPRLCCHHILTTIEVMESDLAPVTNQSSPSIQRATAEDAELPVNPAPSYRQPPTKPTGIGIIPPATATLSRHSSCRDGIQSLRSQAPPAFEPPVKVLPYYCGACGHEYLRRPSLERHKERMHPDEQGVYGCNNLQCGRPGFDSLPELR